MKKIRNLEQNGVIIPTLACQELSRQYPTILNKTRWGARLQCKIMISCVVLIKPYVNFQFGTRWYCFIDPTQRLFVQIFSSNKSLWKMTLKSRLLSCFISKQCCNAT